jgi:hypothetical protein
VADAFRAFRDGSGRFAAIQANNSCVKPNPFTRNPVRCIQRIDEPGLRLLAHPCRGIRRGGPCPYSGELGCRIAVSGFCESLRARGPRPHSYHSEVHAWPV